MPTLQVLVCDGSREHVSLHKSALCCAYGCFAALRAGHVVEECRTKLNLPFLLHNALPHCLPLLCA